MESGSRAEANVERQNDQSALVVKPKRKFEAGDTRLVSGSVDKKNPGQIAASSKGTGSG